MDVLTFQFPLNYYSKPLIGTSLSEPHSSMVYGNMCIDRPTNWPTDCVCPIHVILIHCTCPRCHTMPHWCAWWWTVQCIVVIAQDQECRWWESEKQKHMHNNCKAGMRERPAILALFCWCCHPWIWRTSVFLASHFTQTFFHNFLLKHYTCTSHYLHMRTRNAYERA